VPLVENAVRHGLASRAGGTVTTRRPDGDRLEIRVQDDGVGLSKGWQSHGAGVGLSRPRRIAELHQTARAASR
jgi:LytS/YehU family sensor histidine kinase